MSQRRRARAASIFTSAPKKGVLALGAGAAVIAVALASAAGLGGLMVDSIGAENGIVADPFSDGVEVSWGDPRYDASTGGYVVDSFTVSPNGVTGLPIGTVRVTIATADGTALTEAVGTTTGAVSELFVLDAPILVEDLARVAIVLHSVDTDGPHSYWATAGDLGTDPESIWITTDVNAAAIVDDPDEGEVLQLSGDGAGVSHSMEARAFPQIDNAYAALLDWQNFFNGGSNGDIDPLTGDVLDSSAPAQFTVRVDEGSTLWLDVDVAYGDTADDLDVVRITCELNATATWSVIEPRDCSDIDENLDTNWIATQDWTFSADVGTPWEKSYTFSAGDRVRPYSPAFAAIAGYGFRVEGSGTASVSQLNLRDQTIRFVN